MNATMLNLAAATVLTLAVGVQTGAAQADPVALALDIDGDSDPVIESFTELEAGNSIALGKQTRIEFLHYSTCQTIVVIGGRITFTEQQFLVQRGEIVDVQRSSCPKIATLKRDTTIGGVLLRSGDGDGGVRLKSRPRFAFVGARRDDFERLRILKGETVVQEAAIVDHRYNWPEAEDALVPAKDYVLEVLSRTADDPVSMPFVVTTGRGQGPLTVVRLD